MRPQLKTLPHSSSDLGINTVTRNGMFEHLHLSSTCVECENSIGLGTTQSHLVTRANVLFLQSSPRPSSPVNSPGVAAGQSTGRPSSPTPPGGPKTAIRRRAAADQKDKLANARPSSTRAAGAGGSTSTMLSMSSRSFAHVLPDLSLRRMPSTQ